MKTSEVIVVTPFVDSRVSKIMMMMMERCAEISQRPRFSNDITDAASYLAAGRTEEHKKTGSPSTYLFLSHSSKHCLAKFATVKKDFTQKRVHYKVILNGFRICFQE